MRGSRKFCPTTLPMFLLLFLIGGDNSNTSELWLGSFEIFRGSGPVLQRNPILCDLSGGGGRPTAPSGSADKDLLYCNYMTIPFAFLLPTMGVS